MKVTSFTRVGAVVALATFALAGCSGAPNVDKACDAVSAEYSALPGKLTQALTQLTADPAGTSETLASLSADTTELAQAADEAEVAAAVEDTAQVLQGLADYAAAADGAEGTPPADELADLMREFEAARADFHETCDSR